MEVLTMRMRWMSMRGMLMSIWTTGWREGEGEGEGEGEAGTREEDQPDEADTLLELASVHLSQPGAVVDEAVPGSSADGVGKVGDLDEVMDEVRSPFVLCCLALLRGLVSRSARCGWKTLSRG
jgi:hypothetical protein